MGLVYVLDRKYKLKMLECCYTIIYADKVDSVRSFLSNAKGY